MEVIYLNHKATIPPEVIYGLTERGQELSKTLDTLCELFHVGMIIHSKFY